MPDDFPTTHVLPDAIAAAPGEDNRLHFVMKQRRQRRPNIGKPIVEKYADGEWHALDDMAATLELDRDHVERALLGMQWTESYGCRAEKRRTGNTVQWRLFKTDRAIPVMELLAKLDPIVKRLRTEARKSQAAASPATVGLIAHDVQKLLTEWAEAAPTHSDRARRRRSTTAPVQGGSDP